MTWLAVARKDFRDAIRSRALISLGVFFVVLFGGIAGAFAYFAPDNATSETLFGTFAAVGGGIIRFSFVGFLGFLVGFIAIITTYASVVGERESGTLKILLSLPHSRRDVVLGKLAGRATVVTAPVLAGFVVAIVVLVAGGVGVDFTTLVPQILLTLLLVVVFVAIALGISASSESGQETTLTALGLYFLFSVFWAPLTSAIPRGISWVDKQLTGEGLATATSLKLSLVVKFVNPLRAYETLVASLYRDSAAAARAAMGGRLQQALIVQVFGRDLPWYLTDPAMAVVLLVWLAAPVAYGYYVFEGADL